MAKTAKLKKPTKPPSHHSRASRRASSPSLNLDKSLTSLKPPSSRSEPTVLAAHANAGVTKKKNNKILKRKQKQRLEHGREKAEAVIEKLEKKVERAVGGRERKKGRNADWDKLNGEIAGEVGNKKGKGVEGAGDGEWEDEDEDMEGVGGHTSGRTGGSGVLPAEENGITSGEVTGSGVGTVDEIS
ncbi:hypothetical protein JMJ35_009579 [Cladonia borealis]|uniref:Ribosome biogenesis protein Alb1 n=1 Tax=Cladonia borealis TaxID=184061 RepID=A0AA39V698_9LECA|nr:hypothetical protein JMJ35_009579 [Cladonia borealis]